MNIKTENALLTVEIDAKTINDFITHHLPDTFLTIEQSGKIILNGKYGILPFKIVVDKIEHGEKHICLILGSIFKSAILAAIINVLKVADHIKFNLLKKELIINVEALIKPLLAKGIELEPVIESCFTEKDKLIIKSSVSGKYDFTI